MAVTRFQDLIAWRRARALATDVYVATNGDRFSRDFALRDQVRRSAVSVMANIVEGFGRNRPLEFLRFLDIAQGSCAQVHSHLCIALDVKYLDPADFQRIELQCQEVGMIIRRLSQSIARSQSESVAPPQRRTNAGGSHLTRDQGLGTRDSPGEGR